MQLEKQILQVLVRTNSKPLSDAHFPSQTLREHVCLKNFPVELVSPGRNGKKKKKKPVLNILVVLVKP